MYIHAGVTSNPRGTQQTVKRAQACQMGLLQVLKRAASTQITNLYGTSTSQRAATLTARAEGELRAGTGEPHSLPPSQGGDGTFLVRNTVVPGVKDQYRRAALCFLLFCSALASAMAASSSHSGCLCHKCGSNHAPGGHCGRRRCHRGRGRGRWILMKNSIL